MCLCANNQLDTRAPRKGSGPLDSDRLPPAPAVQVQGPSGRKVSLELKASAHHSGRAKARDNISSGPVDHKDSALRQVALHVPEVRLAPVDRLRGFRNVRVADLADLDKGLSAASVPARQGFRKLSPASHFTRVSQLQAAADQQSKSGTPRANANFIRFAHAQEQVRARLLSQSLRFNASRAK